MSMSDMDEVNVNTKGVREWLLVQAHLQLHHASIKKAIVLLELLEETQGSCVKSGLMLCRAWMLLGEIIAVEQKSHLLLKNFSLSDSEKAALFLCLSKVRWKYGDKKKAKKAYETYVSLASSKEN